MTLTRFPTEFRNRREQQGLSLIELMVALLISFLVALGIIQIFGASRATYQMQDGLSHVQESGRYATQYLQREMRMVGYMGCGADTERVQQGSFVNHLATYDAAVAGGNAVDWKYRFQRPIEAFSASALPDEIVTAIGTPSVNAGTDVLVLRTVSEEAVPVVSAVRDTDNLGLNITVAPDASTVFQGTDGNDIVYAMQNCRSADILVGKLSGSTVKAAGLTGLNHYKDPTVTDCGTGGCPWDYRISNVFLNASHGGPVPSEPQLNAELHRAELTLVYVADNPNGIPSLYVKKLKRDGVDLDEAQELAEGIENLQLRFGMDDDGSNDGQVDEYLSADEMDDGSTGAALDTRWRSVLSVRVGLVVRSPEVAGVPAKDGAGDTRTLTVLDTSITPAADHMMRQVYETTISLRNRIFNS